MPKNKANPQKTQSLTQFYAQIGNINFLSYPLIENTIFTYRYNCVFLLIEKNNYKKGIITMTKNALADFLNDIKENKVSVTVFLINGVKLQGIITWFDENSLLLRRDGHTQLVYKHAVSTIMPSTAIDVVEE